MAFPAPIFLEKMRNIFERFRDFNFALFEMQSKSQRKKSAPRDH